jgi:hypothetical protein
VAAEGDADGSTHCSARPRRSDPGRHERRPEQRRTCGKEGLIDVSGNRPWELLSFCALAPCGCRKRFTGEVGPEAIDARVNLDELAEVDEGRALIDNALRTLVTAMSLFAHAAAS